MRIIFGTGGTGGHLYPALALASYIKKQEPESEFLFVGTTDRLESRVVPEMGYAYRGLDLQGIFGSPLHKVKAVMKFVKSISKSKKVVCEFQPDIVIGFGGYPSSSIVLAASQLGVTTMIHEQNSIIGLANKILIKHVDAIIACYEKAQKEFPQDKTYLYGNPRASQVLEMAQRDLKAEFELDEQKATVMIVMGSLGSSSVNQIVREAIADFAVKPYQVIFVTGQKQYQETIDALGDVPLNVKVVPYIEDMPSMLKTVDLVVTRAGASTLAEITSLGAASLIIPSPYVAMNHQEYNARALYEKEAALMILEKDLTKERLVRTIDETLQDEKKLASLKHNAMLLGTPNASKDIYKLICRLTKK